MSIDTVVAIKEMLEEIACNPDDCDLPKCANMIYEMCQPICPHCGTNLIVEREMFSRDKVWTSSGHNCRGNKGG